MALLDRLRPQPKWKHVDPAVRIAAVAELDDEEQVVLAEILREDDDPRVRRAAVVRMVDPAALADAVRTDVDESVRDGARSILVELAVGDAPAVSTAALAGLDQPKQLAIVARTALLDPTRRAALARLDDPRLIGSVARQAEDPGVSLEALARLSDEDQILQAAAHSEHKDVALAALERVTARPALETIAQRARHKVVARRARALLREDADAASASGVNALERRAADLVEHLESLVHSDDWAAVEHAASEAEATWDDVRLPADERLAPRFAAAIAAIRERLDRKTQEQAEQDRRDGVRAERISRRHRLCERLEALGAVGPATGGGEPGTEDSQPAALAEEVLGVLRAERIRGLMTDVRAEWEALGPSDDPFEADLVTRFEVAGDAATQEIARCEAAEPVRERREGLIQEAQAIDESTEIGAARALWATFTERWEALRESAPSDPVLEARFRAAGTCLESREAEAQAARVRAQEDLLGKTAALAEQLEREVAAESLTLQRADRGVRSARDAIQRLEGVGARERVRTELQARLRAVRSGLTARLRDLREVDDWNRWANLAVQEELCGRMEALLELPDLEKVALQLREIQDRWAAVRAVPRDRREALTIRFRQAQAAVRSRCDAYFAEQAAQRQENLRRKEALCEQAEALADSTAWIQTAEAIKRLQVEWKTIGPVPRQQARPIWHRFRTPCERFFTRRHEDLQQRKAEWGRNIEAKEALCVRAEALAESTDWGASFAELKRLQAEWKTIGPVRRKRSEAIWNRFRAACDGFMERYRRRGEVELAARTAEREALCGELEQMAAEEDPSPDRLREGLGQARRRWEALSPPGAPDALGERFSRAVAQLLERHAQAFVGSELDTKRNRERMEALCARVEALVGEAMPPQEEDASPAAILAKRWRDAMAANTIGGRVDEEARRRAAAEETRKAQEAWRRLGPVPGEPGRLLAQRFERACRQIVSRRPRATGRRPPPTQAPPQDA